RLLTSIRERRRCDAFPEARRPPEIRSPKPQALGSSDGVALRRGGHPGPYADRPRRLDEAGPRAARRELAKAAAVRARRARVDRRPRSGPRADLGRTPR